MIYILTIERRKRRSRRRRRRIRRGDGRGGGGNGGGDDGVGEGGGADGGGGGGGDGLGGAIEVSALRRISFIEKCLEKRPALLRQLKTTKQKDHIFQYITNFPFLK